MPVTVAEMKTWFVYKKCPKAEECGHSESFAKAKVYGETLEEAQERLKHHLMNSGLHKHGGQGMDEEEAQILVDISDFDIQEWPADHGQEPRQPQEPPPKKMRIKAKAAPWQRDDGTQTQRRQVVAAAVAAAMAATADGNGSGSSGSGGEAQIQLLNKGSRAVHAGGNVSVPRNSLLQACQAMERSQEAMRHAVHIFANGKVAFEREAANLQESTDIIKRQLESLR